MSSDLAEPRVYRAGDEQEILDGLNRAHGLKLSLEEWNWAYPPNETGRSAAVVVVDGAIVAHVGGVRSRVHIGGSTSPAMAVLDDFSLLFFTDDLLSC